MTPLEIIEQTTVDGVTLALSPAASITATGDHSAGKDGFLRSVHEKKHTK